MILGKKYYNTPVGETFDDDLYKLTAFEERYNNDLMVILGTDANGLPIPLDIAKAPHLLIGGSTGSGKSVCINNIIIQLIDKLTVDKLKLIFIDPKRVELSQYKQLPNCKGFASEPKEIDDLLELVVQIMDDRYKAIEREKKRHNQELKKPFPYMIVVFDEYTKGISKKASNLVQEIARKGRASNIHLIIATQRPDRSIIDGQLKANCPTRIAFHLQSNTDSRVLLDRGGAETLAGNGDGLLYDAFGNLYNFKGLYISDKVITDTIDFCKTPHSKRKAHEITVNGQKLIEEKFKRIYGL